MHVLELKNIEKYYGNFKVIDNISFFIDEGNIFGLLGKNGAGKTTTMRMILNIIKPDRGIIHLFGRAMKEEDKNIIGYLPEERGLYLQMKVIDHLKFLGEIKGVKKRNLDKLCKYWLEKFNLMEVKDKKVQNLSKGMQQKIQFIGTILHSPKLIVIDEAFSGLDPINAKLLKDTLIDLKKQGTTIILSTHLMEQAEKLCDYVCFIDKGKIVLQDRLETIIKKYSHNYVIVKYKGDISFISSLDIVKSVNDYGHYIEIHLKDQKRIQDLFKILAKKDLEIYHFEAFHTNLNDIFIEIIKKDTK